MGACASSPRQGKPGAAWSPRAVSPALPAKPARGAARGASTALKLAGSASSAAPCTWDDLPDQLWCDIFVLAGPVEEAGPTLAAVCQRFQRLLFTDSRLWRTFTVHYQGGYLNPEQSKAWFATQQRLLSRVSSRVEVLELSDVRGLLRLAGSTCPWKPEHLLRTLQPAVLKHLVLESLTSRPETVAGLTSFTGLTSLALHCYGAPLPHNTAPVLCQLRASLALLSLYGESSDVRGQRYLFALPYDLPTTLTSLTHLTWLQLGGKQQPEAGELAQLPGLAHLALHDERERWWGALPAGLAGGAHSRALRSLTSSIVVKRWHHDAMPRSSAKFQYSLTQHWLEPASAPSSTTGRSSSSSMTSGRSSRSSGSMHMRRPTVSVCTADLELKAAWLQRGETLQQLLSCLLPPAVSLTRLLLGTPLGPTPEFSSLMQLDALRGCAALAGLHSLQAWQFPSTALPLLLDHAPRLTRLSFSCTKSGEEEDRRLLEALVQAANLKSLCLGGYALEGLPAGPYLFGLEELDLMACTLPALPATLCSAARLQLLRVHLAPTDGDQVAPADVAGTLLRMPGLREVQLHLPNEALAAVEHQLNALVPRLKVVFGPERRAA